MRDNSNKRSSRKPLNTEPIPNGCKYLEGIKQVDHKDAELLRKFMTEKGKILSSRSTYTNAKQQRQIKKAIRRARIVGLVP